MYQRIYQAYQMLSNGDKAELKRCNLKKLADAPAYFRALKYSGARDTPQTQRILFLLVGIKTSSDEKSVNVATALLNAGVKESQIIQITRSGDNGIDYLKRQLIRCNNISLDSLGKLAQFWGENARRNLLKDFILSENDTQTIIEE
jgi:CRISPR system Cascade subunit CasB